MKVKGKIMGTHDDAQILYVDAPSKQYAITINHDWIDHALFKRLTEERRIVVITDENVHALYADLLEGIDVFIIKAGEASKCLSVYGQIQTYLIEKNLTRTDAVVALGGGVVGDLAGYVAATYMRGIGFIQIPTSLLAMVDSSVGGKVAINHGVGKNIIGTFYQPDAVYIDTAFLKTLPDKERSCGFAEVIKYGLISDRALFDQLTHMEASKWQERIKDIIYRCCEIKAEIVSKDEEDKGLRQILNFGHTIGHAVESYYHYSGYAHGEGVAIGMYMKAKMAYATKKISKEDLKAVEVVLKKFNLPLQIREMSDWPRVLKEVIHDKKAEGKMFRLIELVRIGETEMVSYTYETLLERLGEIENKEMV
jgi:3-dehydroquinate synthase